MNCLFNSGNSPIAKKVLILKFDHRSVLDRLCMKCVICAGEVRYGKNGHHVTTLMHVDKTLPLWAFFDVYGSTQKIKSLG